MTCSASLSEDRARLSGKGMLIFVSVEYFWVARLSVETGWADGQAVDGTVAFLSMICFSPMWSWEWDVSRRDQKKGGSEGEQLGCEFCDFCWIL